MRYFFSLIFTILFTTFCWASENASEDYGNKAVSIPTAAKEIEERVANGLKVIHNRPPQLPITTVYLALEELQTLGTLTLTELLKVNKTLTKLSIMQTRMSNKEIKLLAGALKVNTTLKELNLEQVSLFNKEASEIAEMLKTNNSLTSLNLCQNQFGDDGTIALAQALEKNSTLLKLDLRLNKITSKGAAALENSLEKNSTLEMVNLEFNMDIDQATRARLERRFNKRIYFGRTSDVSPTLNFWVMWGFFI